MTQLFRVKKCVFCLEHLLGFQETEKKINEITSLNSCFTFIFETPMMFMYSLEEYKGTIEIKA